MKAPICVAIMLAALGVAVAQPPMPPGKKPRLQSPRGGELHFVPAVIPVRVLTYSLHWTHENTTTNQVAFDVESAPTPYGPWTRLATVDAPPFPIATSDRFKFFRVGAHWK